MDLSIPQSLKPEFDKIDAGALSEILSTIETNIVQKVPIEYIAGDLRDKGMSTELATLLVKTLSGSIKQAPQGEAVVTASSPVSAQIVNDINQVSPIASAFPTWDLLPPQTVIQRVKRGLWDN